MLLRRVFWMLGLALCVAPALAQPLTLSGTVHDEAAEPLEGATVVLYNAGGAPRHAGVTDAKGLFRLAPARGTYLLEVRFLGFSTYRDTLRLDADSTIAVVLTATALPADEVVVSAGRARRGLTPLTFNNLTARKLETMPANKDLPVALATTPSVTYYSENGNGLGYTYLRLRGFDERRVAVSINGIPQNEPQDLSVYWINFFDLQGAVTDVQVQRGAGASFYGSAAVAGAINIVADPYKPTPYARVEAGMGAYATRRLTAEANSGLRGGRYAAYARLSRVTSEGYRDWSWTEFTRFFVGATRYGQRSRLTLQAFGGPQRDGLAYYGIAKADNEDDEARRSNYGAVTEDVEWFHQPRLELHHELTLSKEAELRQTAFVTRSAGYFDYDVSWQSPDYLRLPEGFAGLTAAERRRPLYEVVPEASAVQRAYVGIWHMGYLPRLEVQAGPGRLTVGGEVRLSRNLHWGRIQRATNLPAAVVGSEADARIYQYRGEKTIVAAYGSYLVRAGRALAVQADLSLNRQQYRFYDERFFGRSFRVPYTFVNPRVGVTLFPEQPLRGYASVAYGQREPRLKDFYDADQAGAGAEPLFARDARGDYRYDQPFVRPEKGLNVEVGMAVERQRARMAAGIYLLRLEDEIVPSGGLDPYGVPRTGNAPETEHLGLEVEGAARLLPGLDLEGNLTLSRDRFVRFTEYDGEGALVRDGNRIAGFPGRSASLSLRYARYAWQARLALKHAGAIPADNSGRLEGPYATDPYTLVEAGAAYLLDVPGGQLRLALDVNNVLDAKVLLYGTDVDTFFPAARRHVNATLAYTLR